MKRKFLFLALIMIGICLIVMAVMTAMLYRHNIEEHQALLRIAAQSQANLIEAVARHDAELYENAPEQAATATLSQIIDAHERYDWIGETGEFTLARRDENLIVFVLRHRHETVGRPAPVSFDSNLAEPMRRALQGLSGTVIGLDYRGETVLAAYEPVAELNLGIVAKIDLAEIRAPFIRTGLSAAAIAFLIILAGTTLFFWVSNPLIARIAQHSRNLEKEIGRRRQAESELHQFGHIVSSSTDVFALLNTEYIYLAANPAYLEAHEKTNEELVGHSIASVFGDEFFNTVIRPQAEQCLTGKRIHHENWFRHPAYGQRYMSTVYSPYVDALDEIRGFVVSGRDLTERKRAEDSLADLQRRTELVLNGAREGIYGLDLDGNTTFANSAAARLIGRQPEELIGKNQHELLHHSRPDGTPYPAEQCPIYSALRDGLVHSVDDEVFWRKDGTSFPVEYTSAPIINKGMIEGAVVTFNDTTERVATELQLRQAQRMEAVGQLTGGIAHDFNNLLMIILGNLQLVEEFSKHDEYVHQCVQAALNAGFRGADLTKRLRTFSRQEQLVPQVIDVNKLALEIEPLLKSTLGEDITLKIKQTEGLCLTETDPGQLGNALVNLAVNAQDAMPGGGTLTIEITHTTLDMVYLDGNTDILPGEYVILTVSDTGTGIPKEVLGKIFEPFFTTKELGKGTGLGLSMVHGFVGQSKGYVSVNSELGHGTTIKLYLPRSGATTDTTGTAASTDNGILTGRETILMVEDATAVRQTASKLLKTFGYQVIEASTGAEAQFLLNEHKNIDLLFTDMVMPGGITGPELASTARQRIPNLKVLYTSGYTDAEMLKLGPFQSDERVLGKPYRKEELAKAIRETLVS